MILPKIRSVLESLLQRQILLKISQIHLYYFNKKDFQSNMIIVGNLKNTDMAWFFTPFSKIPFAVGIWRALLLGDALLSYSTLNLSKWLAMANGMFKDVMLAEAWKETLCWCLVSCFSAITMWSQLQAPGAEGGLWSRAPGPWCLHHCGHRASVPESLATIRGNITFDIHARIIG